MRALIARWRVVALVLVETIVFFLDRYAVGLGCPLPQIDHLAPLAAERAKAVG